MTDRICSKSKGVITRMSHMLSFTTNPFIKKIGRSSAVYRNNAIVSKHFAMNFGFAGLLVLHRTARPIVISVHSINNNAIMYISNRMGRMECSRFIPIIVDIEMSTRAWKKNRTLLQLTKYLEIITRIRITVR